MALYISTFTRRLNFGSGLIAAAPLLLRARSLLLNLYLRLITVSMLSLTTQSPGWMMRGAYLSLDQKVQADHSISKAIDGIVRCMVASLFCFELDSIPERFDGKSVGMGHIQ